MKSKLCEKAWIAEIEPGLIEYKVPEGSFR